MRQVLYVPSRCFSEYDLKYSKTMAIGVLYPDMKNIKSFAAYNQLRPGRADLQTSDLRVCFALGSRAEGIHRFGSELSVTSTLLCTGIRC